MRSDMLESAIGGIAVPLFEQLWKAGGHVVGQVSKVRQEVRDVEKILKASQNLLNQLKIQKGKIPQSSATANIWESYIDELEKTYLNALELTAEDIFLSLEDWQCLSNYLYANALLLSCQLSSIGISRQV